MLKNTNHVIIEADDLETKALRTLFSNCELYAFFQLYLQIAQRLSTSCTLLTHIKISIPFFLANFTSRVSNRVTQKDAYPCFIR